MRGGRRPGAGAPRGNLNALKTGNGSTRLKKVYVAMLLHTDHRALGGELARAGVLPLVRRRITRRDLRAAVEYLFPRWFDCLEPTQSNSIKDNHSHPIPRAALAVFVDSVLSQPDAHVAAAAVAAPMIFSFRTQSNSERKPAPASPAAAAALPGRPPYVPDS